MNNRHTKAIPFLLMLLAVAFISIIMSLSLGSTTLHWSSILPFTQQTLTESEHTILWQIRLPLTINTFICGSLLALAGLLMQTLLRNPLADPYVLGISSGAAVASLVAIELGLSSVVIHIASLGGGVAAMLIVLGLTHVRYMSMDISRLLLTGIIFAAGCNAFISLIMSLSPDHNLRSMMFWLLGDLTLQPIHWGILLIVILVGSLLTAIAPALDLLGFGHLKATSLGINTRKLHLLLYITSALLTALAVSLAGSIGFIGLIVPHALRLMGYRRHKVLIPGCILLGGSLLCIAGTLSRTVLAPQQLPIGIITAFIGVPFFLVLLNKKTASCG